MKIEISGAVNALLIMGFELNALEEVANSFDIGAQWDGDHESILIQIACEVANTILGNAIMNFPNKGAGVKITPPCVIGLGHRLFKNAHTNLYTTEIKISSGSIMLALFSETKPEDKAC